MFHKINIGDILLYILLLTILTIIIIFYINTNNQIKKFKKYANKNLKLKNTNFKEIIKNTNYNNKVISNNNRNLEKDLNDLNNDTMDIINNYESSLKSEGEGDTGSGEGEGEIQLANIYYKNKSYDLKQHTNNMFLHLMLPDSINIDDYSNIEKYEIIDSPFLTRPFGEHDNDRNFSDIIFPDKGYKLKNLQFNNGSSHNYYKYINMIKGDDDNYNVNTILVKSDQYKQTYIYSFVLTYINTRKCYNITKINRIERGNGGESNDEYDVNIDYCENQDNFSLFYDESPINIYRCGTTGNLDNNDKDCAIYYNTENLCTTDSDYADSDKYKYNCNWGLYPQLPASDFTWVDDSMK